MFAGLIVALPSQISCLKFMKSEDFRFFVKEAVILLFSRCKLHTVFPKYNFPGSCFHDFDLALLIQSPSL